jgi:hypothetical protein
MTTPFPDAVVLACPTSTAAPSAAWARGEEGHHPDHNGKELVPNPNKCPGQLQ